MSVRYCPICNIAECQTHRPAALDPRDARIAELETLLARNLVLDRGATEEAARALGGLRRVFDLVAAHQATHGRKSAWEELY